MARLLELNSGRATARIAPDLGAGIADLAVTGADGVARPVLRPWSGDEAEGPFGLGNNLLVPFSNRIRDAFTFEGVRHDLTRNMDGDYPIHGDGFQRAWEIAGQSEGAVTLRLEHGAFGPLRYAAEARYALTDGGLSSQVTITSTSDGPLPFGMGFHPWFPRSAETRLTFQADHVWLMDDTHMPLEKVRIATQPDWDFRAGAALPQRFINNGFTGWRGEAVIEQGPDARSCRVSASSDLDVALVYSPDPDCGFFCFEPVSHPVDAHNMDGLPGLVVLKPGETMAGTMLIAWD